MPATATRSSRLTQAKQSVEEKEKEKKDATNKKEVTPPSPSKPQSPSRASGKKSPRLSRESSESSPQKITRRSKHNDNQDESMKSISLEQISTEILKEDAKHTDISSPLKSGQAKVSTLSMSVKKEKDAKSDGELQQSLGPSTPSSAPRRSSRAPVPSSRYKDMEVELTPNSQKMKRAAWSSPTDADSVSEPSPKKSRRNSNKSARTMSESSDKECPLPSQDVEMKVADNNRAALTSEEEVAGEVLTPPLRKDKECSGGDTDSDIGKSEDDKQHLKDAPTDKNNMEIVEDDVNKKCEDKQNLNDTPIKKSVEVAEAQSESEDHDANENVSEKIENMDALIKNRFVALSTGDGSIKDITVNAPKEEVIFENDEEKTKSDAPNTFLLPDVSFDAEGEAVESTPQEVSVEEVGLSCDDGGIIVEETVHTYMDEKDVVIQNTDIDKNIESTEITTTSIAHTPKEVELSLDKDTTAALSSSIMLKGQELTVEERDGKMVAIVKIPANFDNFQTTSSLADSRKVVQTEESSTVLSQPSTNMAVNSALSQKSRHGYILHKKSETTTFVTLSDQAQNTVNISVAPTTMSSILKLKPHETAPKPVQKSLYGRVIKQGTGSAKINTETPPPSVQPTPTSLIIKNAGSNSNQNISLLPPPMKATNPKDCKPYSLLSSPSELLQKLKGGDSDKKQTVTTVIHEQSQKGPQLSSPPKKVVIITHPSKPSGPIAKDSTTTATTSSSISSSSSLIKMDTSSSSSSPAEPVSVETNQEKASDSIGIAVDAEAKSDSSTTHDAQDQLSEMSTIQVVEEVASDSAKVEEIVVLSELQDNDDNDTEQKEKCEFKMEVSSDVKVDTDNGQEDNGEANSSDTKELTTLEPVESLSQSAECDDDIMSNDLLITQEEEKSTVEETVITSSEQTEIVVKQENEAEDESESSKDDVKLAAEKGESESKSQKTQKIKLVDNGVVYELQIVSDGDTRALQLQGMNEEDGVAVKQEIVGPDDDEEVDEDGNTSGEIMGKSTLGTQTIYTSKRGRPRASSDKDDPDAPVHKLATIVQEGGQKKHFYYVSVVPGKNMDGKYRRSVEHVLPGCIMNDIGEYCCKECDYKTDKKANFYKHRRLHTGSKPHICQVCKYQARTSSNLKRHMGIHDDIREFKCEQCSLSFRQKIHLERHIRYRHEEKRVKCPMCDYVCANEQPDLKMHIKRKHTSESGKVFTCPQCNVEIGSKRDLKQHLKFHKDGPELKLFCKECSFVTDCKSRLQRHLVVHSNVKPYHCGVCDYKATQKEHVVRHLRSQHKIEVNKAKRPWKKQINKDAAENFGGTSKGDFTCGDKIFACNHCTMRFAKLINLYKHLHTQHSDIMPAESESNYYCVVCEFSTSSKKNLLVHMRRHNMTDQTPPTHVYSCVLCRYVNPRRRNLFQHMRKKHNIDISTQVDIAGMTEEEEAAVRQDGGDKMAEFIHTEPGVFTQPANVEELATSTSSFENVDGSPQVIKDNLAGVANMIKIEDLTRVAVGADGQETVTEGLVIDNEDGTSLIDASSLMHHKAADAIKGLQALAGQGLIIDEEVSTLETKPSIVIEQADGSAVINTSEATLVDGSSIILSADQSIVEEQVATMDETTSQQIQQIVESVESAASANAGLTSLELTEEQLSSLHHGDIVQMEGQVYMVELTQDPDSPDKQYLSFLSINQE